MTTSTKRVVGEYVMVAVVSATTGTIDIKILEKNPRVASSIQIGAVLAADSPSRCKHKLQALKTHIS
jgi:hypothetical protein